MRDWHWNSGNATGHLLLGDCAWRAAIDVVNDPAYLLHPLAGVYQWPALGPIALFDHLY